MELRLGHAKLSCIQLLGDDAAIIKDVDPRYLRAISQQLRATQDWLEVVDGIKDVTVLYDPLVWTPNEVMRRLSRMPQPETDGIYEDVSPKAQILEVKFGATGGPDLERICRQLSLSTEAFVHALCSVQLKVEMMGFTPGFSYLSGIPDELKVPRLATPRVRVPAGSLGFAAGQCGTYALAGPGGWSLVGQIQTPLFDRHKDPPFVLTPGMTVHLVSV